MIIIVDIIILVPSTYIQTTQCLPLQYYNI